MWGCIGFTLIRLMIAPENLHHILNNLDAKVHHLVTS